MKTSNIRNIIITGLFLGVFCLPFPSHAEEITLLQDTVTTYKAKVLEIVSESVEKIPGTDVSGTVQTITIEILSGAKKGETPDILNDYMPLEKGQKFYLTHTVPSDGGTELYAVSEPYRLPALLFFTILFLVLVFVFGGIQGMRGLLALAGSLILILYVLLPGILHGYSPILVSLGVSALIIVLGSYVTHGFNKTTTSAVIGMIITVTITGLLSLWAVNWTGLTGFSSEESVYLNFNTEGSIDFVGLLLGGILIGLLGVLYDVAIGQAISVEELNRVAPHLPKKVIYARAVRIGREHIGALVNTLAIAYVGVSLPLILLYIQSSQASVGVALNREIFAAEIIRTMIGSIGLVIAVPVTTAISVFMLMKKTSAANVPTDELEREKHAIEHTGHHH